MPLKRRASIVWCLGVLSFYCFLDIRDTLTGTLHTTHTIILCHCIVTVNQREFKAALRSTFVA